MLDAFRVSRRITASASFCPDDITAMIAATDGGEEPTEENVQCSQPSREINERKSFCLSMCYVILSVAVESSYTNRVVITILKTVSTLTQIGGSP